MERLPVGKRRFHVERRRTERERGRDLTSEEFLEIVQRAQGTERDLELSQLRAVVCENPYAAKRLPDEMFRGAYDERYGPADGNITRLFAGEKIIELETVE